MSDLANEAISLKGHKDGYEIVLRSAAKFSDIEHELKQLLDQLYKDNSKSQTTVRPAL